MGTTESSINWFDTVYQIGFVALVVAIGFLIYKIIKIKRMNKRTK